MFNENFLRAKIIEQEKSIIELANKIGVCESTFYRKLTNNGSFSRFEIDEISKFLNLSNRDRDKIFFNQTYVNARK